LYNVLFEIKYKSIVLLEFISKLTNLKTDKNKQEKQMKSINCLLKSLRVLK